MNYTLWLQFILTSRQMLTLDLEVFDSCHFTDDGSLFRCEECRWRSTYYFDLRRIKEEGRQALARNTALAQELLVARLKREAERGPDVPAPKTPLLRELGRFWVREMNGIALVSFELVRLVGAFFSDCVIEVESYELLTSIKQKQKGRVFAARAEELLRPDLDYTVEIMEFKQPRNLDFFPGATAVGPFSGPLGISVVHLLFFLGSTGISWVGDGYPGAVHGRIPKKDDKASYWVYREKGPDPGLKGPFRMVRLPCLQGPLSDPYRLLRRLGVSPEGEDVYKLHKTVREQAHEHRMTTFSYPDFHEDEQFLFRPEWTKFEHVPLDKRVHFPSPLQSSVWEVFETKYPGSLLEEESASSSQRRTASSAPCASETPPTPPTPLAEGGGKDSEEELSDLSDIDRIDLDEMEIEVNEE